MQKRLMILPSTYQTCFTQQQSAGIKTQSVSSRFFVGGLPGDAKLAELHSFFSQYGQVADLYLPKSTDPRKRCVVIHTM